MITGRRHHSACFYRLAMRLLEIAEELDAAVPEGGEPSTAAISLRYRVEEMRKDNPNCWATSGNCGACTQPVKGTLSAAATPTDYSTRATDGSFRTP